MTSSAELTAKHLTELDELIARGELSAEVLAAWVRHSYGDPRALSDEEFAALFADLDHCLAQRPDGDLSLCLSRLREGLWRFVTARHSQEVLTRDVDEPTDTHELPSEFLSAPPGRI